MTAVVSALTSTSLHRMKHNKVDPNKFNPSALLPYGLEVTHFHLAMQDVYDFFYRVNGGLQNWWNDETVENTLPKATVSGIVSGLLLKRLGLHAPTLTPNRYHNGHPNLVPRGLYKENKIRAGDEGLHVKATVKSGGGVDRHAGRNEWVCVFVYEMDRREQANGVRSPLAFTEVYLGRFTEEDYVLSERKKRGTDTARLSPDALSRLQENWVFRR